MYTYIYNIHIYANKNVMKRSMLPGDAPSDPRMIGVASIVLAVFRAGRLVKHIPAPVKVGQP